MLLAFLVESAQLGELDEPVARQGRPEMVSKGVFVFAPETPNTMMFQYAVPADRVIVIDSEDNGEEVVAYHS
jgi:hypothetical protein